MASDRSGYVSAARAAGRRAGRADRIADALAAYQDLKRRRGVVDFDDLLAGAARELASDGAWAEAVRWRFRHVLVDEAQDLNPLQYRLLEQLVDGRGDLYLVGDPAQAIYAFNGADPGLLVDISERMPGIEIIELPTNHRSTPQIVAAGAAVLRAGGQARPAMLVADRGHGRSASSPPTTRRTRPHSSPSSSSPSTRAQYARATSRCSPGRTARWRGCPPR